MNKENKNAMEKFPIRAYSKKELALKYFPDSNPHAAVRHLMSWVNRCSALYAQLLEVGYVKSSKGLSPREVRLIVEHLGDPEQYL